MIHKISKTRLRLNLMRGFLELVKRCEIDQASEVEEQMVLSQILEFYILHLERVDARRICTMDDLFGNLKKCVRLCADYLDILGQNESANMEGWVYGCSPTNPAQMVWGLLTDIIAELTPVIAETELSFPRSFKRLFNAERADYAKLRKTYGSSLALENIIATTQYRH